MDPLTTNPAELPPAQSGARGAAAAPADAHARWRLELERAQLALRPQAGPAQAAPANAAAPADSSHPSAPAGRHAAPDPGARRTGRASEAALSKESLFKGAPQAGAAGQPRAAGAQAGGTAFAGAPAQPREMPAPPQSPPAPGGRLPQRAVWPSTNAFALVTDDQVKAWVRDASLGEAERKRLLQELRARLSAAGLKLDTLTVNGREESTSQGE